MAAVTDSILNIVILLATVIILGIVVSNVVTRNTVTDLEQDRTVFVEERTDIAVDAILSSTEQQTSRSISELIGISMFTLKTDVTVENVTVDIVNETRNRLDLTFGKGNYFMTLKPIIKGVNLMFVLDSSPSVSVERETIALNLEDIQEAIENTIRLTGEEKVNTQIFMLPTTADSECQVFDDLALPDTTCEQLSEDTLYEMLLPLGWERPGFAPGKSYDDWAALNYYPDISHFAVSDWAAGTATAAMRFQRDPYLQNTVNLNLIFPLSDELATTSISDQCFNRNSGQEFFICHICRGNCPVQRSQNASNQSAEIVRGTSSIVFPIYSFNCDFNYDPGYNQMSGINNGYIQNFNDEPGVPFAAFPSETWCHQNACPGCSVQGSNFCFHDNCQDALRDHMELIANTTGGSVIDVNDATDIPTLIETAFERATASYNFQIGYKDDKRDRFVFEKIIPLPNSALGEIHLWVYTDPPRICQGDESCLTNDECEGTRRCIDGNLSEACEKNDPSCIGRPCTGPELCLTSEDCIGTKACIDTDGDGVGDTLSQVCTKSDPFCEAPCFDSCPQEGAQNCSETEPGSGTYSKMLCLPNSRGCLRWEPIRQCEEPCQSPIACGEDPSCPYDNCLLDDDCNVNCSQNGLCYFDPDCPFQCPADCRQGRGCNVWCSPLSDQCSVDNPSCEGGCPMDPDCPTCMNRGGDRCPTGDPGCCVGNPEGSNFVWAQRRHTTCPLTSDALRTCFGVYQGEPPPFGTCCPNPSDCTVLLGSSVSCISAGTILDDYIWSGSALCVGNIMEKCFTTNDGTCDGSCCAPQVSIGAGSFECNYETGMWEQVS